VKKNIEKQQRFILKTPLVFLWEIRGWGFVGKKSLGFSRVDKQIDKTKIPNPCHKKKLLPIRI